MGQQGQHLQGCIAVVLVAAVAAQARRLLLVCLGIEGDVGQQGQRPHGRIDMRARHECGCIWDANITCALDLREFWNRVQHKDMCSVMKNGELSSPCNKCGAT